MEKYLFHLNNSENRSEVMRILNKFSRADLLPNKVAEENVELLKTLNNIGEGKIYEMVVNDFRELKCYKNLLFTDAM
ncbi:hypothetical protein [Neobacillus sp. YIM B06451]|uniref:hypothetical protein n=1 Tax=Neobacillus sp. YIM B06451 TaxID=3070994 RepID=UPI00292CE695|nr:hypothetical protein [Neobacillus sp. YIM B06451]